MLFSLFPVSSGVWNSKVFLCGLYKLFSEALLKLWVLSVGQRLLGHIVAVLDVVLLCLPEALKLFLESRWVCFFCLSEEIWFLFHFLWLLY